MDITKRKQIALQAVQDAGEIVKNDFYCANQYNQKGKHDVVTETDFKSEALIIEAISKNFPYDSVISEEMGNNKTSSEYRWYIDPLDGTSNFITGNPYFAVSTGLCYQNKMVFGVVYNPITKELYTGENGKGAFLNTQQIKVSATTGLDESFIAIAFAPYKEKIQQGIHILHNISTQTRRIVINFAPSLDLCNIACGKLDGLIDHGTTPEDHAAGSLILKEAGGVMQNPGVSYFIVDITGIIASNGLIQKHIIKHSDI